MPLHKSAPAYKGARFDAKGFCLVHSDVRLCRLTSEGRYKIVRKTCYKCGSAALMTEPKSPRTTPHGYKKKALGSRDARGELFKKGSSGAKDGRRGREDKRRARTLSPRRGRAQKQGLLRKPFSASHVEQTRMSNRAIKEPPSLQPPPFAGRSKEGRGNKVRPAQSQSISKRSSSESHNTKSRELTWGLSAKTWAKGREILQKRESGESEESVEGVGRCRVHPEVRLGIKRTLRGDGSWQISKDVCPCCFPHRLTAAPLKSDRFPKVVASVPAPSFAAPPKTVRSSPRARPATPSLCLPFPSSSPPDNTPRDYFSTALVLYKEEVAMPNSAARMARAGEKKRRQAATSPETAKPPLQARPATLPPPRCLPFPSPRDTPEEYFATALVLHKKEDAMPNSAARMARAGEKKRRQAQLEERQRRRAYEEWESLPVGSVGSVYAC